MTIKILPVHEVEYGFACYLVHTAAMAIVLDLPVQPLDLELWRDIGKRRDWNPSNLERHRSSLRAQGLSDAHVAQALAVAHDRFEERFDEFLLTLLRRRRMSADEVERMLLSPPTGGGERIARIHQVKPPAGVAPAPKGKGMLVLELTEPEVELAY